MPRALVTAPDAPLAIELEYDTFGDPAHPAVLLIMGTGMSLTAWDDDVCVALAGEGRFVIRYDNRDIGRSTKVVFEHDPARSSWPQWWVDPSARPTRPSTWPTTPPACSTT